MGFFLLAALAPLPDRAALAATTRLVVGDLVLEAPAGHEADLERLAAAARRIVPQLERDLGVRSRGPYRIVVLPSARPLQP